MSAEKHSYLAGVIDELARQWPHNRMVNVVCHGHSVPAGYACTGYVNTFGAYPYQLHRLIKERFPFCTANVIVTAIGGEESEAGAARFEREVLCHRPDVLTIDYGLNDRRLGLVRAEAAWRSMIEGALERDVKIILMTPTWDQNYFAQNEGWTALVQHAAQIRRLADEYQVGLADSFAAFERYVGDCPDRLTDLMAHGNHPNEAGHHLAALELGRFFPAR